MRWFTQLREWLDGENPEPLAVKRPGEIFVPVHRTSQEFLVFLARRIDQVLQQETFVTPKGTTFTPREFQVMLSPQDHRNWQDIHKHAGLLRWLQEVFEERLVQIISDPERGVSFIIKFSVDESLGEGQVQVLPLWDSKTEEKSASPAPSNSAALRSLHISPSQNQEQEMVYIYRLPENRH